jgi:hypothetical protein
MGKNAAMGFGRKYCHFKEVERVKVQRARIRAFLLLQSWVSHHGWNLQSVFMGPAIEQEKDSSGDGTVQA